MGQKPLRIMTISDLLAREEKAKAQLAAKVLKDRKSYSSNPAFAAEQILNLTTRLTAQNHDVSALKIEDIDETVIASLTGSVELGPGVPQRGVGDADVPTQKVLDLAKSCAAKPGSTFKVDEVKLAFRAQDALAVRLPEANIQSEDNPAAKLPAGFRRRNCSSLTLASVALAVIVVIVYSEVSGITRGSLDFITRKPGEERPEEKEVEEEDLKPESEVVEMLADGAACRAVDVSWPFTVTQAQRLLKEAHAWYYLSDSEFWTKYAPRDISSSDKLLPSELLYQVLVLSGYSPLAYQLIATRPSWSWIFPKDGMTLSMVLATLYTEKGPAEMYDYIESYRYYKKPLPRSIAIDVVIAALLHLVSLHG